MLIVGLLRGARVVNGTGGREKKEISLSLLKSNGFQFTLFLRSKVSGGYSISTSSSIPPCPGIPKSIEFVSPNCCLTVVVRGLCVVVLGR